jgi:hypothetical protein
MKELCFSQVNILISFYFHKFIIFSVVIKREKEKEREKMFKEYGHTGENIACSERYTNRNKKSFNL